MISIDSFHYWMNLRLFKCLHGIAFIVKDTCDAKLIA